MTNEELYERITSVLEEQGIAINQFELKVKTETGKYPNLRITKSRLSLPNTVAFPYLTMFFDDDEMHELILKKMNNSGTGGEAMDLLDELLYSLNPSKEYLYKQRLKRRMQREVKWMELKIVDTPKELRKELGDKCIFGVDENGQAFYTKATVRILEVE